MTWQDNEHRQDDNHLREPHIGNGVLKELRTIDLHLLPDFRKTAVFGLIALAALIAGEELGGVGSLSTDHSLAAYGCAALVAIFGVLASRTAAGEVQRVAVHHGGDRAGTPLRITVLLIGYMIAVISFCDLMDVDVGHLLIGGAITGIVVGLAAQPILGNLFAGLVLLFARPYIAGERIRVLSGAINGPHEGVVVSAGLLYTTLLTPTGPLNIPNSTLLAAAVGAAAEAPPAAEDETGPAGTSASAAPVRDAAGGAGARAAAADDSAQKAHDLATAVAEGQAIADSGQGTQKPSDPGEEHHK
jgi:small-conductance mechanosensitive channel